MDNTPPISLWQVILLMVWTLLGFLGAGISVGIRLARGEQVNKWTVITAGTAGASMGGTTTMVVVDFLNLNIWWSLFVALLLGLMAMGFMSDAVDGKIQFINRLMGRT